MTGRRFALLHCISPFSFNERRQRGGRAECRPKREREREAVSEAEDAHRHAKRRAFESLSHSLVALRHRQCHVREKETETRGEEERLKIEGKSLISCSHTQHSSPSASLFTMLITGTAEEEEEEEEDMTTREGETGMREEQEEARAA